MNKNNIVIFDQELISYIYATILEMESYVQDGGYDVISRRKVMPSDECTRSVCPTHMQQRPPVLES